MHLGDSSEDDGEFIFNPQSPSPQSKQHSKIPLMRSSSLRSSMDSTSVPADDSSPFSTSITTASPKAIETVRQITRLETPLKKTANANANANASASSADLLETPKRSYNYGFTVTPFDPNKSSSSSIASKREEPSAEELLKRLANTREQFHQTLNAERTSPKILSRTIEDEWTGMSDFLKQPAASPYTKQKYSASLHLGEEVSETESVQLKNSISAYEDTRSRLERIRQKSKEMLSDPPRRKSSRNYLFYSFLLFVCASALYFVFFDERRALQLFEYHRVNDFFRTLNLPPLGYEDFYAKVAHYLGVAREYGEGTVEWARECFDL